ncbi:MAG: hypothetical protein CL823_04755 [Crocinitomicaceae bacterium]|nr:hypothetical protein [Crocinitomicaceae bacterium]
MINKNIKILGACLATLALFPTSDLLAQETDTLSMDVTFVGEREMVVKDAIKLQSWPEPRRLDGGKKNFSYKLLSKRMNVVPSWTKVEPVRLKVDAPLARLYRGYARAGYGVYNTPFLDISLTDLRSREGTWGVAASHFATDVPNKLVDERFKDSELSLWSSKFLGKEKVDLSAHLGNNSIVYYGSPLADSLAPDTTLGIRTNYTSYGASLGLKSHHRDSLYINHEADFNWIQLIDGNGTVENNFNGRFEFKKFSNGDKIAVKGNYSIDRLTLGAVNPNSTRIDAAIVGLEPSITTYKGPLTAKLGAGLWIDADSQSRLGDGNSFYFYPQAELSIRLLRDIFVPYLSIDGGLAQNRLQTTLEQNPFYHAELDNELRTTSRKRDVNLGMRGTLTDALSFNMFVSTVSFDDYMYFINDIELNEGSRFTTFNDTLNVKSFGGDVNLSLSEKLDLRCNATVFKYDHKQQAEAWNLPGYTASLDIKYTFLERFTLKSTTTVVGERMGVSNVAPLDEGSFTMLEDGRYSVKLPGYLDLNLNFEYRYSQRTAIWISTSNLTGSNYRHWTGYRVQGTQALLGASYAF